MAFTLVQCGAMTLAPTDLMYGNENGVNVTPRHKRASAEIFRAEKIGFTSELIVAVSYVEIYDSVHTRSISE